MIVGFAKHGTGGGSGPVNYLTQAVNPDGTTRTPTPEVIRGDPALVRKLIDALPFERTYTSGVLSFAPGEVITPAMEQSIIDRFEQTAFAGLEPDRYSILWVRHLHAGHHELHFVTPRVELVSGKSLNIHPPGRVSQRLYDTFRSIINAEYALADPEDPARSQAVSLPNHLAKLRAAEKRQGKKPLKADIRETLTEYVRREVEAGRVQDQAGVVRYLKEAGFAITREGADYVSVLDRETGQRIRLKGSLFSRERFNGRETTEQRVRYGIPDPVRAAALAAKLEPMVEARARFHQQRYGVLEHGGEAKRERGPWHGPEPEPLRAYVARHLGGDALHTTWAPRRQRARSAMHDRQGDSGRASYDRTGATLARRLTAFGAALQRAGRHYATALADLDRASGRLERARGAFGAGAAALDPWDWLKWRFYGHDQEGERWYDGPDIER